MNCIVIDYYPELTEVENENAAPFDIDEYLKED